MSKFTEALNVLFGKKVVVIGITSFELKDENLHISDGSDRWVVSPSSLGLIYLVENSNQPAESSLVIGFSENISYQIHLKDNYSLNEKKLNFLLELKTKTSKESILPKVGAFSLVTIINTVLVFFIALTIFNSATGLMLGKTADENISKQNSIFSHTTRQTQATLESSPSSTANLSPEQQLRARNDLLIKPNPELASLLQKGVKAGDYAFSLGPVKQSDKGTLYVFSDPLCPRCQDLEPLLEKLSADYRIEIFPVSVIGTPTTIDASSRLVKTVLCELPESRGVVWQKIMRDPNIPNAECEAGPIALKNNIDTYHAFNFIGTPALVRADGASFDLTKRKSVESVARWLGEVAQ